MRFSWTFTLIAIGFPQLVLGDEVGDATLRFMEQSRNYRADHKIADEKYPTPAIHCEKLKPGLIGEIAGADEIEIQQVIDERTLLVAPLVPGTVPPGQYSFDQFHRLHQAALLRREPGPWFFLEGIPTGGLSDGQKLEAEVYEVVGTRAYESAIGAKKTVPVLKVFNIKSARESIDKLLLEEERKAREQAWLDSWKTNKRIWKDKSGRFSVEAIYHSFKPGKVVLQKADKSTIEVDLKVLSDEDRRIAVGIARKRGEIR